MAPYVYWIMNTMTEAAEEQAMKRLTMITAVFVAALTVGNGALAQDDAGNEAISEDLELTMTLMPAGAERADVITKSIELPEAATLRGHEASEDGRATAEEARQNREFGLDTADEARERGREFGEEMAEQARENREDAGRGEMPDDLPGPPDDLPVPPIDKPQN